jgi:hypothetical protein
MGKEGKAAILPAAVKVLRRGCRMRLDARISLERFDVAFRTASRDATRRSLKAKKGTILA